MRLFSFIILQLASLLVMALFIHEYKRITHKHEELIRSIDHGKKPPSSRQSTIIIWIYIVSTFVFLFASTALYFLIPNS